MAKTIQFRSVKKGMTFTDEATTEKFVALEDSHFIVKRNCFSCIVEEDNGMRTRLNKDGDDNFIYNDEIPLVVIEKHIEEAVKIVNSKFEI